VDNHRNSSLSAKIWNIFATYGCAWLWVSLVVATIAAIAPSAITKGVPALSVTFSWLDEFPRVSALLQASPGLSFFMAIVFAPLVEEVLFRMLPLSFGQVLTKLLPKRLAVEYGDNLMRALVIGVCGIGFGFAHGHPINVFIQGFVGFMLGVLYLRNASSQFTSYFSCVAVHAAYNFTVMAAELFAR
jgi:membrane protease YdiL (CAAX protease family)